MNLLDTIKEIVIAHDQTLARYRPIFISYPSWEEPGPLFATREEAQVWLDRKIAWSGRKGDWGYIMTEGAAV